MHFILTFLVNTIQECPKQTLTVEKYSYLVIINIDFVIAQQAVFQEIVIVLFDLETDLVGANDLITQLRHELQVKTDLLHVYTNDVEDASPLELRSFNVELLQKKINDLEEENKNLHEEASKVDNKFIQT